MIKKSFTHYKVLISVLLLSISSAAFCQTNRPIGAEIVYIVLDSSGSMANSINFGGNVSRVGEGGDRRWDFALDEALYTGDNLHGKANRRKYKHIYVRFLRFTDSRPRSFYVDDNVYRFYQEKQTSDTVRRGRRRPPNIVISDEVRNVFNTYYNHGPSGTSAVYQSLCAAMKSISDFNEQELAKGLRLAYPLSGPNAELADLPANLKIDEREIWFYSDLEDNASLRCEDTNIKGRPGKEELAGDVVKVLDKYKDKHEGTEFKVNFVFKVYDQIHSGVEIPGAPGAKIKIETAREIKDLSTISERYNGHVHLRVDDQHPQLISGHANCYEHDDWVCAD